MVVTVGASVSDIHGNRNTEWDESKWAQTKWQQKEEEDSNYKPCEQTNLIVGACHLLSVTNMATVTNWNFTKSNLEQHIYNYEDTN